MMRLIVMAVALLIATTVFSADSRVRGHVRKDGAYVPPHHRTTPNSSRTDNYSSRPNTNPYTGKRGTVDPYAPKPPRGSRRR